MESSHRDEEIDDGNDMYFRTGKYAVDDPPSEGVYEAKSPPPSPSREATPPDMRKRHAHCPHRLKPYTPPLNYGTVMRNQVFRSAFPGEKSVDFMRSINIKSIVCLVTTEPCQAYTDYVDDNNVACFPVEVEANKEGRSGTTVESMYKALMFVLDKRNYPLMIHCNQGRHRTGCLVACLRLMQGWAVDDAIAEYNTYASPKARPGDVAFIKTFQPAGLLHYARVNGYLDCEPLKPADYSSITTVESLVELLAYGGVPPLDSSSSDRSDSSIQTNLSSGALSYSSYSPFDSTMKSHDDHVEKLETLEIGSIDGSQPADISYAAAMNDTTHVEITSIDEEIKDADSLEDALMPWVHA